MSYNHNSKADDGKTYRSQFEADVVNKYFLPSTLKFEYEKCYQDSRQKCDFYLSDFDIYIECVFHDVEINYNYQKLPINEKIYIEVKYHEKELYKTTYHARWDDSKKSWYFLNDKKAKNYLHNRILNKRLTEGFLKSDVKAITTQYDDDLRRKLVNNTGNVIILTRKDLDKYQSLGQFLAAKNNPDVNTKVFNSVFSKAYTPISQSVIAGKKMSIVEDLKTQLKFAESIALKKARKEVAQEAEKRVTTLEGTIRSLKKQVASYQKQNAKKNSSLMSRTNKNRAEEYKKYKAKRKQNRK